MKENEPDKLSQLSEPMYCFWKSKTNSVSSQYFDFVDLKNLPTILHRNKFLRIQRITRKIAALRPTFRCGKFWANLFGKFCANPFGKFCIYPFWKFGRNPFGKYCGNQLKTFAEILFNFLRKSVWKMFQKSDWKFLQKSIWKILWISV